MQAVINQSVKTFFLSLALLAGYSASAQTYSPEGYWLNDKGNSKIHIFKTTGGTYAGRLVWLKEPNRDGKPKLDSHNPNEALRSRPLMGLIMLTGLRYDEKNDYVDGKAYDPSSGKNYSCKLTVNTTNQLTLRGFVGFSLIGKSVIFTRTTN